MPHVSPQRAQQTFTTTGTGTLTLGSAVSPDVAFSVEMADGDTGLFAAEEFDAGTGAANGAWEVFRGTIGATGTTLTRDTVLRSSTGTSAISWAAGTKRVFALQDSDPLPLSRPPSVPGAGILSLGRSTISEFPFLAFKGASGLERLVQPFLGTIPLVGVTAFGGGNTFGSLGQSPSISGTAATVDVASTDVGTRTPRMNLPTSAAAGNVAGIRNISRSWFVGSTTSSGGVFFFAIVTQGTVAAGQRVFIGPRFTVATPTNVDPATLTNSIGLACIDGSDNWHIVFGGSAAQTPIDLGANFPSRGSIDDKIQFSFYWPPGDNGGFYYEVIRNEGAFTASGFVTNTTPGTTLPADTTGMPPNNSYWTNNTTAAVMSMRVSCMLTFVL